MRRYALYSFVISLLWLGFVCSSFIVMFSAPPPAAIEADGEQQLHTVHLVYLMKAFVRVEWVSCLFAWFFVLRIRAVRERGTFPALTAATLILLLQSFVTLPSASFPWAKWNPDLLMIFQGVKVAALAPLAAMQIQSFARAVISE